MGHYVDVICAGDLFPANLPYNAGFGVAALFQTMTIRSEWQQKIQNLFIDSDVAFANLESPLINDCLYSRDSKFAGHKDWGDFLNIIGINIVSIANNHILEQGSSGFINTIDVLSKNDIHSIGIYSDGLSNIVTIKINEIKLGFVAYNAVPNKRIKNTNLYAEYSREKVLRSIDLMKSLQLDYQFISIHWGDEYIQRPSLSQITDAREFIEAGANFIIGHHPHVIQPVEEYKNGLIFYSLGNFIFDMNWTNNLRTGLLVKIKLGKNDFKFEIVPVKLGRDYIPTVSFSQRTFTSLKENLLKVKEATKNPISYEKRYLRDVKTKRLINRILMKQLLLKNWFKYPQGIRKEFIEFYLNKFK